MFLESIARARRNHVHLIAATNATWAHPGWEIRNVPRTAAGLGDPNDKPFLKDLLDLALESSAPDDWLLYSNVDCAFAADLYEELAGRRATVVEYQRLDVENNPRTLDELFSLPHWDTICSGFFRRFLPVQRDCERLYHPKHPQAWDLAHPTHAGSHNQHLFVDALTHGLAEKTMIADGPDRTDTAVIVAVFGNDPARVQANVAGIEEQLRQDLYCDHFLVELVDPAVGSVYPEHLLRCVKHIAVPASEASGGLFQKEALYNRGWRSALAENPYEYFIFLDADIYCKQRDWFRRIRARLQEEPRRAVQGWRTVRDTEDPELLYSSVGAAFVLQQPTDLPLNPGMCWGLHRALLQAGDGFNPFCVDCAGDSAFVAEYLNTATKQYDPWLYQWGWFREIERPLPFHAELDCVPMDLIHVHHGALRDRNYDGFRYALDAFPPLHQLVQLNSDGVLEWRDTDCTERKILQHRSGMISRDAVDQLLDRFQYRRYSRKLLSEQHRPAAKRPFDFAQHHRSGIPALAKERVRIPGLKIFDPEEIFRPDFPFSWCDGIVKREGSTYIPLKAAQGGAVLVLEGKPDTTYVVCALPIEPTWLPVDLTSFHHLRFSMRVTGNPPDVLLSLVSQTPGDVEIESKHLSLKSQGLHYSRWVDLSIPLASFAETVDLSRIRLIKLVGYASFHLELRRIYIQ